MKCANLFLLGLFILLGQQYSYGQPAPIRNKHLSMGMYGRMGIAYSPGITGAFPRSLNLLGHGSVGGRMEENDYLEWATALHFKPVSHLKKDTTEINVQLRLAFYTTNGQFLGNVNTRSFGGITIGMPELYAEANHINGSPWSVWIGAKLFRGGDIHLIDQFHFDDHSGQGAGVKYKHTTVGLMLPQAVDTSSSLPPYFYLNIVNGAPVLGLRERSVLVLEQLLPLQKEGAHIKLLGELHQLAKGNGSDTSAFNYPADRGWVLGVLHQTPINSKISGSFQQFTVRYGRGIANGGDGGGTKTFLTYGGPNLATNRFRSAYSIAMTETFLWHPSRQYAINGYALFTKSKGASDSTNTTSDYLGRSIFNRKTDFAVGMRNTYFIKNWLHFIHELHYTTRKDGDQPVAGMTKLTLAPTIVPGGENSVWSRPHFRLVYSVARYNKFAAENLYSAYLKQSGSRRWAHYIGIKTEWWLW